VVKSGIIFNIPSKHIKAKKLNPPKNFCNVLAKELNVTAFESVQYSKEKNLVVMKIVAKLANLDDFTLPFSIKEEIKSKKFEFPYNKIVYYTILPHTINEMRFSYFNTDSKEFKVIRFDIVVKDESVSTQSDIKPNEDKNKYLKITIFVGIGTLLLLFSIFKKSILSFIFALAFIGYGIYLFIPLKKVCIKRGAKILILPTKNSTIFKINSKTRIYEELGRANGYIKIKLSKDKIGWVKNEDNCKN
jgi:hypothetical protein